MVFEVKDQLVSLLGLVQDELHNPFFAQFTKKQQLLERILQLVLLNLTQWPVIEFSQLSYLFLEFSNDENFLIFLDSALHFELLFKLSL